MRLNLKCDNIIIRFRYIYFKLLYGFFVVNNNISIQELIKESQCSEPGILDKWLKTNKPNLEICYSDISMAFWKLSQTQPVESPSLAIKEVSIILDKSQLSKSLEYIGRKSLDAVQKL